MSRPADFTHASLSDATRAHDDGRWSDELYALFCWLWRNSVPRFGSACAEWEGKPCPLCSGTIHEHNAPHYACPQR